MADLKFVKDGDVRWAGTPAEAVSLRSQGWCEQGEKPAVKQPAKAAHKAAAKKAAPKHQEPVVAVAPDPDVEPVGTPAN